jgi:hypothetical protein
MRPPRASSADRQPTQAATAQTSVAIAQQIEEFLALHPEAAVLEDGKL